MSTLLSIGDLPRLVACFGKNLNAMTLSELDAFLASEELRYLPFKSMLLAANRGDAEWAVRIYLNQQDKLDRNRGKFHGWMMKMCGVL
jgi:hypothetical protein